MSEVETMNYYYDLLEDPLITYKDFEKIIDTGLTKPFEGEDYIPDPDKIFDSALEEVIKGFIMVSVWAYYAENDHDDPENLDFSSAIYEDDTIEKATECVFEILRNRED